MIDLTIRLLGTATAGLLLGYAGLTALMQLIPTHAIEHRQTRHRP